MKTEIYNLIILDESGSMTGVHRQTVNGCNETIDTIKCSQQKFADTQEHYVSIFAFNSGGRRQSRYIIKNVPGAAVQHITMEDYSPSGCTPLFDAIGSTVTDLKATVNTKEMAIGSVTIITDGEENSSVNYDHHKVSKMIEALKEMGWNFSFIGANIDVKKYAQSLNIDNHLEFQQDEEGTRMMFECERNARMAYHARIDETMACQAASPDPENSKSLLASLKKATKDYFNL